MLRWCVPFVTTHLVGAGPTVPNVGVQGRGAALSRSVPWNEMLDRGIPERPQYSIDFGLVARPLRFKPLKNISI